MTAVRRGVLTAVPFGIACAAYLVVFLTRYDRLPARIATHFSADGGADDFMSRAVALWFGGGLLAGLGLLFTILTVVSRNGAGARLTAAVGAGTAVTLGYPLIVTVLVNTDVRNPAEVRLPMWHLAVLLLAAAAVGTVVWWLVGAGPRPVPASSAPSLPLADGEAAAWSRTVTSRVLLSAAGALALGGVSGLVTGPVWAGVLPLVLAVTCVVFASVRVTVDRRGLTVASTVLPGPRMTVPLARIAGADSVRVDAVGDFGGWGYRIRPNRRGLVLRSGEALAVRTAVGRDYVVTVDDSTTGAALLNGLVDRDARGRG